MKKTREVRLRQRRIYVQPDDASIHVPFYTPEEAEEHKVLVKSILRSPEPTSFKEYQQWLHDWRRAWKREMQLCREQGQASTRFKLAGGFGRYADNCAFQMTPRIREAYETTCLNFQNHRAKYGTPNYVGYGVQKEMLEMRVARKPLGKTLWEAQSKKD